MVSSTTPDIRLQISCGDGREEWVDGNNNVLGVAAETSGTGGKARKPLAVDYPNEPNPIIDGRVTYLCILPDGRRAIEFRGYYYGEPTGYRVID